MTTQDRRQQLEYTLILFEAESRVPSVVRDIRDIYKHRHFLKQLPFSEGAVAHLAKLIRVALETGQRFRLFDSLKVLKSVVVAGDSSILPPVVVRDLFSIYSALILESREEVQWCLSRLIRDRPLEDHEVTWLVKHWKQSVHIANRLLRYPTRDRQVERWAKERYNAQDIPGRRSEVVALLLHKKIEPFTHENPETLAWAVMQARVSREQKIEWLSTLVPLLSAQHITQFALRLSAPSLITRALDQTEASQQKTPNRRLERTAAKRGRSTA